MNPPKLPQSDREEAVVQQNLHVLTTQQEWALGLVPDPSIPAAHVELESLKPFEALAALELPQCRTAYCANCKNDIQVGPNETRCPECGTSLSDQVEQGN